MTHLLANLGWVDLDLGCSTILLRQKVATVAAHGGTSQTKVNQTQVRQQMGQPVHIPIQHPLNYPLAPGNNVTHHL